MARAARTASVIVVLLGALALAPSVAGAAVLAKTEPVFPADVTVGDTDVSASLVLTNVNDGSEFASTNNVCNVDSMSPCDGMTGIELIPACIEGESACMTPTLGVLDVSSTAVGAEGSACAGTLFDVTDLPGSDGAVRFTPTMPPGELTIPGEGMSCEIDFTFDVVGIPPGPPEPGGGVATQQLADAAQHIGSELDADRGISSVRVHKATPAITTQASPGIALGGTVTDTATVTGRFEPSAGATVTFTLFGPDEPPCQPPVAFTSTVPIAGDGTATSAPFPPTRVGTYRWTASYDGDDNNASVGGGCGGPGETVTVTPAPVPPPPPPPPPLAMPTIAVAASPGVTLGGLVFSLATLTGRSEPAPGETVRFGLFGPDDPGCAAQPLFTATAPVTDAGLATSPPFTPPLQVGVYRWVVSYGGDARNVAVATACGAPGSTVAVQALPAGVLSAGFTSPPRVGAASFLTVAAFDPLRPIAGLQVLFGEPRGATGVSACRLGGFGISVSPVRLRLPFVFRRPGRHRITIVVLSGDCRGELTRTVMTTNVTVAAGSPGRAAYAASPPGASARAAQGSCKNASLRPTSAKSRVKVANAILCLVNAERRKKRLKALKRSSVLTRAAAGHSGDMIKRRFFEHAGPGGPSLQRRLTKVRYRGANAAENIGYGQSFNARLIVQAWMNSPPHKANILSAQSKFAGVGAAIGIPVPPGRPGSVYTIDFGSALK
jgi:uncharacterized protein YkwD